MQYNNDNVYLISRAYHLTYQIETELSDVIFISFICKDWPVIESNKINEGIQPWSGRTGFGYLSWLLKQLICLMVWWSWSPGGLSSVFSTKKVLYFNSLGSKCCAITVVFWMASLVDPSISSRCLSSLTLMMTCFRLSGVSNRSCGPRWTPFSADFRFFFDQEPSPKLPFPLFFFKLRIWISLASNPVWRPSMKGLRKMKQANMMLKFMSTCVRRTTCKSS